MFGPGKSQKELSQFSEAATYTGTVHWIQKEILRRLILHPTRRFSELKPDGVESNLFMYHLRSLIRDGYVAKTGSGYTLSAAGKRYADRLSLDTLKPRIQPKIVSMIVCRNARGEYLLYRRVRQPFSGMVSFPHGKIHLGETVAEAAARELSEKGGLRATLRHRGEAYLTVYQAGELVTQTLCHVFTASRPAGTLRSDEAIGRCFWGRLGRAAQPDYAPGLLDVAQLAGRRGRFFEEFSYRI